MTITGNTFKPEFFFVSPMEVVKVTTENMEQVAEWCGGTIAETESRRVKGRMDKYVWVPTPKGTKISWAFPGMYISKRMVVTLKDELVVTYSVFRKDYFTKNYFGTPNEAVEATWERADKAAKKERILKINQERRALVQKVQSGASLEQILGEPELHKGDDTPIDLSRDIAGVPEEVMVLPHENGGFVKIEQGAPHETVDDFEEAQGVVLTPEEIYHDGSTVVEDAQRETPHSPLPEPREAEEHEKIAEEMEPAPDDAASILEGNLTPDVSLMTPDEIVAMVNKELLSSPDVKISEVITEEYVQIAKDRKAAAEDEELDASKSGIPTPEHIVERDQEQLRAARLAEYHKNKALQS